MMLSGRADLEEERRLFYVAITRAERKLFLSYAITRYRFGRLKSCEPSRFLDEIDTKFIKVNRKFHKEPVMSPQTSHYAKSLVSSAKNTTPKPANNNYTHKTSADFKPSDTSNLEQGMSVEHAKFGYGKVLNLDIDGANRKAKVLFDNFGEKTLLLSFAKLKIHI